MSFENFKAVIFRVGCIEYGLHIEQVSSIERMQPIQSVPKMPQHVMGILDLRGSVIPVVDLRTVFEEDTIDGSELPLIIIVNAEDNLVGLVVDEATDILDIPEDVIQPISFINPFSIGVAKLKDRLLILVDTKNILANIMELDKIKKLSVEYIL